MRDWQRVQRVFRCLAVAVPVLLSGLEAEGSPELQTFAEESRVVLEASLEARTEAERARELLRSADAAYREHLQNAHAEVLSAMVASSRTEWRDENFRDRRVVLRCLLLADRQLDRSELSRFSDRPAAVYRLARSASRHLARAVARLQQVAPPAPPAPPPQEHAPPASVVEEIAAPTPATAFQWTEFKPSHDTQIVYVSSSAGSDANSGLSELAPVKTISKGYSLLRNGYPDWLLLRRGDTWLTGPGAGGDGLDGLGQLFRVDTAEYAYLFQKDGRSSSERMVVAGYGTGPRPHLKSQAGKRAVIWPFGSELKHVAFVSLDLKAYTRDPADPGFVDASGGPAAFLGWCDDVLIEDCRFAFYTGMAISPDNAGHEVRNISIRGCVVADSYSATSHSQGLYANSVDGLLIEGCYFIHNGWHATIPGAHATIFNRNFYIANSPGTVIRDCVDADGSSGGMQLRRGGLCEHNLFIRAPLAVDWGHAENPAGTTATGTIRDNVILGSRDIAQSPRGFGINLGPRVVDTQVYGNIVARNVEGTGNVFAFSFYPGEAYTCSNIEINNNIVYDWDYKGTGAGFAVVNGNTTTPSFSGVSIYDNDVQQLGAGMILKSELKADDAVLRIQFANNRWSSQRAGSSWFQVAGLSYGLSAWSALVADTTSTLAPRSFPDPGRDIATYMSSLGYEPTIDEFLARARHQNKADWNQKFTPAAVIAYVREGFGWGPAVR